MRLAILVSTLALTISAGVAEAQETTELLGDSLRAAVAGKTVLLATPVGSLPSAYRTNGTMTAKAAHLAQFVGSESDSGRWWVTGSELCQQWTTWLDEQAYCYRMRRSGSTVHWSRNDGRTGTAEITR